MKGGNICLTTTFEKSKNGRYVGEDGTKWWYKDGNLHRDDGPAIMSPNSHREWRKDGCIYNEDGPAIICSDMERRWKVMAITLWGYIWWWDKRESIMLNSHKIVNFLIQPIREII